MINGTKGLIRERQSMQSVLHYGGLFENQPTITEPTTFTHIKQSEDEDVKSCIDTSFGAAMASKHFFSVELTWYNISFKRSDIVVLSTEFHPTLKCLQIHLLISDGKAAYALGQCTNAFSVHSCSS